MFGRAVGGGGGGAAAAPARAPAVPAAGGDNRQRRPRAPVAGIHPGNAAPPNAAAAGGAAAAAPAAPAAAPANNDANQHSMAEMFNMFPHESAIVMRRGIELGIVCSCLLVTHCVVVIATHWNSQVDIDRVLRVLAVLRVICATPRPYYWFHTRAMFVEARYQPTPQLVARRLMHIYNKQSRVERVLFSFYYAWLVSMGLITLCLPVTPESGFSASLWKHCMLNVISLIGHRLLCVSLFYYLMHCDLMRGIPKDIVNKYTTRFIWEAQMRYTDRFMRWSAPAQVATEEEVHDDPEEADCAICYGQYSQGESIRRLKCGHTFHCHCIDTWLLGHQNKCPLCGFVVGPPTEDLTGTEDTPGGGVG